MAGAKVMRQWAWRMAALAALVAALGAVEASAEEAAQRLFPTPEEAAAALTRAVQDHDRPAITAIVGPDLADFIQSQGAEANAGDREQFLQSARRATVLRPDGDDRRILEVGLEAWPFPAPLVHEAGGWRFDGAEGVEAVKDRIAGRNELEAIDVLRAYVAAQQAYAAEDRDGDGVLQYAQRLASTPGKRDGLYWPVIGDEEPSP